MFRFLYTHCLGATNNACSKAGTIKARATIYGMRKDSLRKRHSLLSQILFLLPPPPSLHCTEHVYIHTDRLYMNYRETFLHRSERCEVLTGYLSLGRRSGGAGPILNIGAERFTVCFWTGSGSSSVTAMFCYLLHFLRRPLLEIQYSNYTAN